jgi:glyoxylase I family protein
MSDVDYAKVPLISGIHHVAIIASNYERSKKFYTEILGFNVIAENFRKERSSYKLDLKIADGTQIELFSFPDPPKRTSRPEACGLRHLALKVQNVEQFSSFLHSKNIPHEPIRTDEYTGKRFFFFADPDDLPIELYEVKS